MLVLRITDDERNASRLRFSRKTKCNEQKPSYEK